MNRKLKIRNNRKNIYYNVTYTSPYVPRGGVVGVEERGGAPREKEEKKGREKKVKRGKRDLNLRIVCATLSV